MSYLEIKELQVSFGTLNVVKNVNLSVEKGQFITFLGPSGCGKTTLMRTIAGLEKQQSGKIILEGKEIQETPARLRKMGMVFQSYALFPNLTVYENVAFGLKVKKVKKEILHQKVEKILALVNLTERKHFYPSQLSGGQQQRVSLARALVVEPKVLLLDEPLSALDAKIRKQIQSQLRKIQRELGITMIFVTHDQEEAMVLSDWVYVMEEGRIVQGANPETIYAQPNSEFVAQFIGNYNQWTQEEIDVLLPQTKSQQNRSNSYFLRPELVRLEPTNESDLRIEVKCESVQILGNIVRAHFMAGDKAIIADFLNYDQIIKRLEQTSEIFVNDSDFIIHERKRA